MTANRPNSARLGYYECRHMMKNTHAAEVRQKLSELEKKPVCGILQKFYQFLFWRRDLKWRPLEYCYMTVQLSSALAVHFIVLSFHKIN